MIAVIIFISDIHRIFFHPIHSQVLVSIVVSIPACHAGDRVSIPRRGVLKFFLFFEMNIGWNYTVKVLFLHFFLLTMVFMKSHPFERTAWGQN